MSDIEVSRVIAASPEALYDIVSDLPQDGRAVAREHGWHVGQRRDRT